MIFQFIKSSFSKIKSALARTRAFFGDKVKSLFQGKIDDSTLEKLEQLFYEADMGVQTAVELTRKIREIHLSNPSFKAADYIEALNSHLISQLNKFPSDLIVLPQEKLPMVILIVGVNGNGKTTTVAKLAHLLTQNKKKVLIAAADTFRAAAIEQLDIWAQRLNIDIVKGTSKSDPAAVAFDAIQAAKSRSCDVVLVDTAGRLHTKIPLMQELEKIRRSCHKASSSGPHETLLILDATTGQNAIDQAKHFHKFTPLTGLILTKLDGTAKGGIVIAIQREIGLPIKFIGTGEQIDDLEQFDSENFIKNLF